ncbi:hypothetical protein [Streptomyces scopuliridis]|uniref:Secreted protein n=1 Tax=Streptomyces scopuliridis RB72 TaxID=1440053 RepID=A0A2T7T9I1_9ACTN|nr:hypothetical protein [Streptomyces scopuliridis]PVE11797.1 hypothetical protein Y717_00170 [Streptomyces scopuliridis RB72]
MKKITALAATGLFTATLLSGSVHTAQAAPGPDWNKTAHCKATDPEGRHIVTRVGNAHLGWNHFTHRHNIRVCKIIDAAVKGKVDRNDHHGRLEYDGVAVKTGNRPQTVHFVVIVQYSRYTKDKKYDAGRGQKIGVVNAFCRNQPHNKCPAWMNK